MADNNVFEGIDFSDDNGAEALDLAELIPSDATTATVEKTTPPVKPATQSPATPAATPEEDLLELPDDGFEDALKKETSAETGSEEKPIKTDDTPKPHEDEPSSTPYSSLAALFHEKGVLSDTKGFNDIKDIDEFTEKFQEKIQDGILSEMTDDQRKYFEALKAGVPTQWYHEKTQVLDQLNKVQEDSLIADNEQAKTARFNLIYNDFVSKGYNAEDAKQLTSDQFQLGRDKELSKKALGATKARLQKEVDDEIAAKQNEQEAEIKAQQKAQETIKDKIYNSNEIAGIKLGKPMQDKVFNTATKVVGYDKNNRPLTAIFKALNDDPVETQIKLSYLWALTNGGQNMNPLVSKASSKVAKEVEEMIISGSIGSGDQSGAKERVPNTKTAKSIVSSLAALGIGEKIQPT